MKLKCNCCDGIYNSFDVHFTSACDNRCAHCIDAKFEGLHINRPDVSAIVKTIIANQGGLDDVLFLGGEPCLYLTELLECVTQLRALTKLKLYVTTSVPKICHDQRDLFVALIDKLDGINLSVQHHNEDVADQIRCTTSRYDRQTFYAGLPYKSKIRINLNIVKPFLYTKDDITACLQNYDAMRFNTIKLSEIQHGKDCYVSFADVFNLSMPSAYANGCQSYLDTRAIFPEITTSILLKRSCFMCEDSLPASVADGVKAMIKLIQPTKNKYGIVYGDGTLSKGWL